MIEVTMLNSMAGEDFGRALAQMKAWGVRQLDLKDCILGKGIADLTDGEARTVRGMIDAQGMSTYCLSTGLFYADVELGEQAFRSGHLGKLDHVLAVAAVLRPRFVRLLAASSRERAQFPDSVVYLRQKHPWLLGQYQQAIDRIVAAGFEATIENEVHRCILARPSEVIDLFGALDRRGKVSFTWDVQNFWQMGTYPTMDVYNTLRPLIGYAHFKGGQHEGPSTVMKYRCALEDASYPAADLIRAVARHGVSPVVCLNPPHGQPKPGYDYADLTRRDAEYARRILNEKQA